MANNKNIAANAFKTGDDPRRYTGGRPKKWTTLLKAEGYTLAEIQATYAVLLSMSFEELLAVKTAADATSLERTIANAIRKDYESGTLRNFETILSRAYGAPKQNIETTQRITIVDDL